VQARLAQIFQDDIFAGNSIEVVLNVIGSTILSTRVAFLRLKGRGAGWASPCYEARGDVDIAF